MKAKRVPALTDGAQVTLKGNEPQVRVGVPAPYHCVDGTLDDPDEIERVVRRAAGRFVGTRTRRRPVISATAITLA